MLDIEHHTIVLSVTYAGQPGEDLADVCARLVGAVARSPGVTGAVAMDDLPLTELHNHITDQLYAMFPAEHGGITALRPLLRSQVNEAYKRGATASLAMLCDIHDPAGWPSLEARMATTFCRAARLGHIHQAAFQRSAELRRLVTELACLLDLLAGLTVEDPGGRARRHMQVIDQLTEALQHPTP